MSLGIGIGGMLGSGGGSGGGGTLTIGVFSDVGLTTPVTSGNYGAIVYIKATPTDIVPTSYTFSIDGSNDKVVSQAGDTYAWTIDNIGVVSITARATDGSGATANATPFAFTSTLVITNSVLFDGVNDYIVAHSQIQNTQSFSVSFWFKMNNPSAITPLFSFKHYSTAGIIPLTVYYNSNAIYYLSASGYNFNRNTAWVGDMLWHHFTFTYDSGTPKVMRIYVDGVELTLPFSDTFTGLFDMVVLASGYDTGRYGNINIADFSLHDSVLTPAEITSMQTLGVTSGHEVQRYPFTEAAGTTTGSIVDVIGSQNAELRNFVAPNGIVADTP